MSSTRDLAIRTVALGIVGNLALAIVKGVAGVLGHSYALVADAIESATDACASVLLLAGLRYATRPADDNHPYGHGRAEPLLTFVVVAFLLVAAAVIALESVRQIGVPHESPAAWTLLVLGLVIAIKELAYRFVSRRGQATRSTALQADAWHHRSDALTSLAAFIGISIALVMGDGWEAADDWAALAAAAVIVVNAYLIFRPALGELMDEQSHGVLVDDIRRVAAGVDGVVDTEKCFVRKTGIAHHVDLHLIVDGELSVRAGHEIAHRLKAELLERLPELTDVLVHVEPHVPCGSRAAGSDMGAA